MADTIVRKIHVPTQNPVDQKFVDLGDDTFAAAVSVQNSVAPASRANYDHANGIAVAVSTTPLRALGVSTWTGASGRTAGSKGVLISNLSEIDYVYALPFDADQSIPAITSANAIPIAPLATLDFELGPDENGDFQDIALVRKVASTDPVLALEYS